MNFPQYDTRQSGDYVDELTRKLTNFDSFESLLTAKNWVPTISAIDNLEGFILAEAYDIEQAIRDDQRRVHRI